MPRLAKHSSRMPGSFSRETNLRPLRLSKRVKRPQTRTRAVAAGPMVELVHYAMVSVLALLMAIVGMRVLPANAAETVSSGNGSVKALVKRLQHHYKATDSFSAKFIETITRVGAPPREREGGVYYEKPGRMRWEFDAPQVETIVSDGTTIYDYDAGLNQVVETSVKQAFKSQTAAAFFLGVGNIERDFDASAVANPPSDGLDHVTLTPKGGGDRIEVGIDPKTFDIVTLALADQLGNKTTLKFGGIERNSSLKSSLFTFTPPQGADIVSPQG